MAPCSFRPSICMLSPRGQGFGVQLQAPREQATGYGGSRRSSSSSATGVSGGYRTSISHPQAPSYIDIAGYVARYSAKCKGKSAPSESEHTQYAPHPESSGSDCSEYWSNSRDEVVSLNSHKDHDNGKHNIDVTILPCDINPTVQLRPPRIPGHKMTQIDAEQTAFNHAAADQLRVVQRMQERRRLSEDAMTQEVSSVAASSGSSAGVASSSGASAGVASFAAAWRRNSCASTKEPQRHSSATQEVPQRAALSEAAYSMETDLNAALTIDVQDHDIEGDSDLELWDDLGSLPHSDEEDQVIGLDEDAGAFKLEYKVGDAVLERSASPCHGGG